MLLEADDLRVDVCGVPAVDGLSVAIEGPRALVLGAPRALMEAAGGQRPVARGTLRVGGLHEGARVAFVALDPPLPPRWSPSEYVAWSARLAGVPRSEAPARAAAALERCLLSDVAKVRLDRSPVPARRATVLAAALAAGAQTFVIEDPLAGLPEEVDATFARILVGALAELAWLVFAPRVALASPLALAADEAVLLASAGARVEAQGPPSDLARSPRHLVGRLAADAEGVTGERIATLAARVASRGGHLEVASGRARIDLGEELRTAELLGLALEAGIVFLELGPASPRARALA
jgi:ABC-type taurine transport system ATPase subunit